MSVRPFDGNSLTVGTVQEGAPEIWSVVRHRLSELQRKGVISDWKEGIDRLHFAGAPWERWK